LKSTLTRESAGTTSFKSCNRLEARSDEMQAIPVMLPPGRAMVATSLSARFATPETFRRTASRSVRGLIVVFVEFGVPDTGPEPGDLDERVVDRRGRLENPLLAVGKKPHPTQRRPTCAASAGMMHRNLPATLLALWLGLTGK